MESGFD